MSGDSGGIRGRAALDRAFRAAVDAAEPTAAVQRAIQRDGTLLHLPGNQVVDLDEWNSILLVGAGKATEAMSAGAIEILGNAIRGGTIAIRDEPTRPLPIEVWQAGHPIPNVHSLAAAADALRCTRESGPRDLLLCLLSGGASALWCAPVAGVSLADFQDVTRTLLRSGAAIAEVNAVRKHLSRVAGGWLAAAAGAGRIVTLAISDVLGDQPDAIGSGPTVPDPTTYSEALEVLSVRSVNAPRSVLAHLQAGAEGRVPETPNGASPLWARTSFDIVASLRDALEAAERELAGLGYETRVMTASLVGEARDRGAEIAREALRVREEGGRRIALVWGGETTVTVRGRGRGGRNQEMALAAAIELTGREDIMIGCFATDGSDGPTDAAGGYADGGSVGRALANGVDAAQMLDRNDAYTFLTAADDLIRTGPTGTNVNDLAIAVIDV